MEDGGWKWVALGFGLWALGHRLITNEQEVHLATVVETLQSIKQSDMSPMLSRIYASEGGLESLDVLMKYL